MLNFIMILILILTPLSSAVPKKKTRPLYFRSVKFDKNAKFLNNFEISINADNTSIDILMELREDIDNFWSSTNMFIWLENLNAYKQIMSYDIDLCQQLQRTKLIKTNIIGFWVQNVLKFGNLTKSCPILKDIYLISHLKPDRESIPTFTPAGRCRLVTSIYTTQSGTKETVGNAQLDMELK